MSTREGRRSAVYRQLEAYQQSWQGEHNVAMLCRDLEELIAVGTHTFSLLREQEQAWRDQVFRGTVAFDPNDDREMRDLFAFWLETTEQLLEDPLPLIEAQFRTVEGADRLRGCAGQAKQTISTWQTPRLASAVGLREMAISSESAVALTRLIEQTRTNEPDMPVQLMRTEDASFLKR